MGEETLNPRDAYRVMLRDYPDVLNIDQMCEILSVSTKTGYALLKKGSIQHLKVGRSYRIPKAHLLTYLIGFAPGHTIRDRKSTRLNSSHRSQSRMPSSA